MAVKIARSKRVFQGSRVREPRLKSASIREVCLLGPSQKPIDGEQRIGDRLELLGRVYTIDEQERFYIHLAVIDR